MMQNIIVMNILTMLMMKPSWRKKIQQIIHVDDLIGDRIGHTDEKVSYLNEG